MSTLIKTSDEICFSPNKDEMENAKITLFATNKDKGISYIRVFSCNDGDIGRVAGHELEKFIEELWSKGYDPVDITFMVMFGVI